MLKCSDTMKNKTSFLPLKNRLLVSDTHICTCDTGSEHCKVDCDIIIEVQSALDAKEGVIDSN